MENQTVSSFEQMQIHPSLLQVLAGMKITTPTEIQSLSIPVGLSGQDLIAVAETGSGKTLAYALSVVTLLAQKPEARALILSPSRETAEQIHRVLSPLCLAVSVKVSLAVTGLPLPKQANELKKMPQLIIATPGRMNDHLQQNKLLLKGLQILVVDEADRMLDLGFESQLRFIQGTLRGERQTLMFAATFGQWAQPIAQIFMRPNPVMLKSSSAGAPVETLTQKVYFLSPAQKERRLLDEVKKIKGSIIIFAESQDSCVAIGRLLGHHQFSSEFVHGDMNPGHRNRVLREFREGRMQILVTTDLLARGLDIPGLEYVISYDLPYRGEEFLHRIGRTARAGQQGHAITFITPTDGRTYRRLKSYLENAEQETLMTDFKFIDRD
jgi:superfamily II DNA/RNA helicase